MNSEDTINYMLLCNSFSCRGYVPQS